MRVGEGGLELANGLPFVVEDWPAVANPARTDIAGRHLRLTIGVEDDCTRSITLRHRPGLRLHLSLDLATKAVRIGEAVLNSYASGRRRIAAVSLTRERIDDGPLGPEGILAAFICEQVINDSDRCAAKDQLWIYKRGGQMGQRHCVGQIR